MKVYHFEQRSKEWYDIRKGKVTGTRLKALMGKDWLSVVDEVVAEIITGQVEETYINQAMQWGIDNEPIAKVEYEKTIFSKVHEVGFCVSDKYKFLGVSPDGWVGSNGGVEIKCPNSKTHQKYIRQDKLPTDYRPQIVDYFLVNEDLEWLDFVSFDPRNDYMPLFIKRVLKDELLEDIQKAETLLDKFWNEVIKQLKRNGYPTENL